MRSLSYQRRRGAIVLGLMIFAVFVLFMTGCTSDQVSTAVANANEAAKQAQAVIADYQAQLAARDASLRALESQLANASPDEMVTIRANMAALTTESTKLMEKVVKVNDQVQAAVAEVKIALDSDTPPNVAPYVRGLPYGDLWGPLLAGVVSTLWLRNRAKLKALVEDVVSLNGVTKPVLAPELVNASLRESSKELLKTEETKQGIRILT